MTSGRWPTALTEVAPERVLVRGFPLDELAARQSFASVLWLLFTGRLPDPEVEQLVNAILVLSIDHGPGSPSALTSRTVSSAGGYLTVSAAAGVLAMGEHHGSPAGAALELLREIYDATTSGARLDDAAESVIRRLSDQGRRFPGFGHRQHKRRDDRIDFLLGLTKKLGLDDYIPLGQAVQAGYERRGRQLPINLDGAIAIALGPLPLPPALATAIFMVSRFAGLNAHAWEEHERMRPMRVIEPSDWFYDGPTRSPLPGTVPR